MTSVKKGKGKSKKNQEKESKSKSTVICPTFRVELSPGEIVQKKESKSKSTVISPTFRVELSPGEIAEDWYGLTVRRPTRPILRRPKEIQKILDNLFPGLLLQHATKGEYDVAD